MVILEDKSFVLVDGRGGIESGGRGNFKKSKRSRI